MYKIPAKTLFIGKNLVYVPECHSTNTLASELSQRTSTVEGTVIITDNQTNGRGQRGNSWISDPHKNLTFSLILKPTFLKPADQFYLTMAISLALHDYLSHGVSGVIKIKWPNDLLVNDKKVCGILIENTLAGDTIQNSVVGIGLNVNQDSSLMTTATSMKEVAGHDFSLPGELELLDGFLESRYLQLRSGKIAELKSDYLNCLYGKGELRRFIDATGEIQGVIHGIDHQGKLLMDTHAGLKSFDLKEIRFIG